MRTHAYLQAVKFPIILTVSKWHSQAEKNSNGENHVLSLHVSVDFINQEKKIVRDMGIVLRAKSRCVWNVIKLTNMNQSEEDILELWHEYDEKCNCDYFFCHGHYHFIISCLLIFLPRSKEREPTTESHRLHSQFNFHFHVVDNGRELWHTSSRNSRQLQYYADLWEVPYYTHVYMWRMT